MKYAFFKGKIVPFEQANISIMTHAFNYGTGVFEGIRGYWNADKNQLYLVKLREHYERLQRSANLGLKTELKYSIDELCDFTIELAKKNGYKEDVYFRPIYYKSQAKIGLGLIGIEDDFCMFMSPFGNYLDISKGIKVCVSSWWRISARSAPQGAKMTGTYFNSSLAKAEALEKGFDGCRRFRGKFVHDQRWTVDHAPGIGNDPSRHYQALYHGAGRKRARAENHRAADPAGRTLHCRRTVFLRDRRAGLADRPSR